MRKLPTPYWIFFVPALPLPARPQIEPLSHRTCGAVFFHPCESRKISREPRAPPGAIPHGYYTCARYTQTSPFPTKHPKLIPIPLPPLLQFARGLNRFRIYCAQLGRHFLQVVIFATIDGHTDFSYVLHKRSPYVGVKLSHQRPKTIATSLTLGNPIFTMHQRNLPPSSSALCLPLFALCPLKTKKAPRLQVAFFWL